MWFLKTFFIICFVGCCFAAPKPIDWDDVGNKIKHFGNQVRDKYHEIKEKVLPGARSACEFVNHIPLEPHQGNNFYHQRNFHSSGFPHYFHHSNSFQHGFPHHPYHHHQNFFPSYPTTKRTPSFNSGGYPINPTTQTTTTTEQNNINRELFNTVFTSNDGSDAVNNPTFNSGFPNNPPIQTTTSTEQNLVIREPFNPPDISNGGSNAVVPDAPTSFGTDDDTFYNIGINGAGDGSNAINPEAPAVTTSVLDFNGGSNSATSGPVFPSSSSGVEPKPTIEQEDMMKSDDIPPFIAPNSNDDFADSDEDVDSFFDNEFGPRADDPSGQKPVFRYL